MNNLKNSGKEFRASAPARDHLSAVQTKEVFGWINFEFAPYNRMISARCVYNETDYLVKYVLNGLFNFWYACIVSRTNVTYSTWNEELEAHFLFLTGYIWQSSNKVHSRRLTPWCPAIYIFHLRIHFVYIPFGVRVYKWGRLKFYTTVVWVN